MSARRLVLFLLLTAAIAAAQSAKPKKKKWPKWKSGVREGTVLIDGKQEAFTALVPRGFTQKKAWPAVLLAHGNGGAAANFLRGVKSMAGKKPPLLISLERCDNKQDAVGYAPKYLERLKEVFHLDENNVYALGFSGGGFRLWDDSVCNADALTRFAGVVLVGCGKQSYNPPEKPAKAPAILFVGDPKDSNYGRSSPAAADGLKQLGYEVLLFEHSSGHTLPRKEMKAVFEWIRKRIKENKKKARKKG